MSDMLRNGNSFIATAPQGGAAPTPSTGPSAQAQSSLVSDEITDRDESADQFLKNINQAIGGAKLSFCDHTPSELNAMIHSAKVREVGAEKDLFLRAELILHRRLYGLCEISRELIRSVDGVSVTGCAVQAWLNGPVSAEPSILAALIRLNHRELDAAYASRRGRRKKSTAKQEAVRRDMKKALVSGDNARQSLKFLAD